MSTSRLVGPTMREKIRHGGGVSMPPGSKPPNGAVVHLPSKPAHIINNLSVGLGDDYSSAGGLELTGKGPWIDTTDQWYNVSFWFNPSALSAFKILGETTSPYVPGFANLNWILSQSDGNFLRLYDGGAGGYLWNPYYFANPSAIGEWHFMSVNIRYLSGGGVEAEGYQWHFATPILTAFTGDLPTAVPALRAFDFSLLNTNQALSTAFDSVAMFKRRLDVEEMDYLQGLDNGRTGRVYADLIDDGFDLTDMYSWYDMGETTGAGPRYDAHNTNDLAVVDTGTYPNAVAVTGLVAGQARDGDPVTKWVGELGTQYDAVPTVAGVYALARHEWNGSGIQGLSNDALAMTTVSKDDGQPVPAIIIFDGNADDDFYDQACLACIAKVGDNASHKFVTRAYSSSNHQYLIWHAANGAGYLLSGDPANYSQFAGVIPPDGSQYWWWGYIKVGDDEGTLSYLGARAVAPDLGRVDFQLPVTAFFYVGTDPDVVSKEILAYGRPMSDLDLDQLDAYLDRYADGFDPSLVPGMTLWLKDGLLSEYPEVTPWHQTNDTPIVGNSKVCRQWKDVDRGLSAEKTGSDSKRESSFSTPGGQVWGVRMAPGGDRGLILPAGNLYDGYKSFVNAVVLTPSVKPVVGSVNEVWWYAGSSNRVYFQAAANAYKIALIYNTKSGGKTAAAGSIVYGGSGETQFTRVFVVWGDDEGFQFILNGVESVVASVTDFLSWNSGGDLRLGWDGVSANPPDFQFHENIVYGYNSRSLRGYAYELSDYLIAKYLGTPYP